MSTGLVDDPVARLVDSNLNDVLPRIVPQDNRLLNTLCDSLVRSVGHERLHLVPLNRVVVAVQQNATQGPFDLHLKVGLALVLDKGSLSNPRAPLTGRRREIGIHTLALALVVDRVGVNPVHHSEHGRNLTDRKHLVCSVVERVTRLTHLRVRVSNDGQERCPLDGQKNLTKRGARNVLNGKSGSRHRIGDQGRVSLFLLYLIYDTYTQKFHTLSTFTYSS